MEYFVLIVSILSIYPMDIHEEISLQHRKLLNLSKCNFQISFNNIQNSIPHISRQNKLLNSCAKNGDIFFKSRVLTRVAKKD